MAYKLVEITCSFCDETKMLLPNQKYCSRECYYNGQFTKRSKLIRCETCKEDFSVYPSQPTKRFCSVACFSKSPIAIANRTTPKPKGKDHWNWKGGVMKGRKDRNLGIYKNWRRYVFERDNYTCQHCNKRGGDLEADHIKPWVDYPDLRYEVDNGRTLCLVCHRKRTSKQFKERYSNV